jgi:hypothetical protein
MGNAASIYADAEEKVEKSKVEVNLFVSITQPSG